MNQVTHLSQVYETDASHLRVLCVNYELPM